MFRDRSGASIDTGLNPPDGHHYCDDSDLHCADCQQAEASGRTAGPAVVPQLAACDAAVMDIISLSDAPAYDSNRVVAQPFLEGSQSKPMTGVLGILGQADAGSFTSAPGTGSSW